MIYIGNNYLSQLLAPPICRIPKWGKRDGDVVVVVVLNLKYNFDERIEGRLVLGLEVEADVVGQFVDAPIILSGFFLQKIGDTSIPIRRLFLHHYPLPFSGHPRQANLHIRSRSSLGNIQNMTGESISCLLSLRDHPPNEHHPHQYNLSHLLKS